MKTVILYSIEINCFTEIW